MTTSTPPSITELANDYLGNIATDAALGERLHQAQHSHQCLEVALDRSDRMKGRIHVQALSGEAIGIVKDRSWSLAEGDVLQTQSGKLLLIHLKEQGVIVLQFAAVDSSVDSSVDAIAAASNASLNAIALVHLGHTLGNHHYPISLQDDSICIPVTGDRQVIESTISSFKIPGLVMRYEQRSQISLEAEAHAHSHEQPFPNSHTLTRDHHHGE